MVHYKYLIVGGGIAGDAAIHAIRKLDADGSIGLIAMENHSPYDRPPLSKGLWMEGDHHVDIDDIWHDTGNLGVNLHLDRTAMTLQPAKRKMFDHQGLAYDYESLLIATGGTPRRLRADEASAGKVIYFRTVDDYHALREKVKNQDSFAVIGGGFIGSEIAAALATAGKRVTMIFPEKGICAGILPETLSKHMNGYYTARGVSVLPGESVAAIKDKGAGIGITLTTGKTMEFDAAVAGTGILPETTLAQTANLTIDNGILVDTKMRASMPGIYAAGDVASFVHPVLKTLVRFEHEDNANATGKIAGQNMAGKEKEYTKLPMFYSDMFEHGYEAVGDVSTKLDVIIDWKEEFEEGVFYYVRNGLVRGVLLWNVWDRIDAAREIIMAPGVHNAQNLAGRIPM